MFFENRSETNFKGKAELFIFFFSRQCSLVSNHSSLPSDIRYIKEKRLPTVTFSGEDKGKYSHHFKSSKASGHDNINIRILKIFGNSIWTPLEMIFKQSLLTGVFPLKWKKRKFFPIHKKSYKQNIENDRSVSLHPIKFLK